MLIKSMYKCLTGFKAIFGNKIKNITDLKNNKTAYIQLPFMS